MNYEILITEVTCYGSLRCIAGWDINSGAMVRPEPTTANNADEASRFWDSTLAGTGRLLDVGNVVSLEAEPSARPDFPFPHATEDRVVLQGAIPHVIGALNMADLQAAVAPGISPNLAAAFDGGLNQYGNGKAWVAPGHQGRSLGALETAASNLTIFEDTSPAGKRQLRALLVEGTNRFDLSLTAEAYKGVWPSTDAYTLRQQVHGLGRIHLRVGLARAFGNFGCMAQVNGIYAIP